MIQLVLLAELNYAQTEWGKDIRIITPAERDTVISGQLLITIKLPDNYQKKYAGFAIYLDQTHDLSELIKVKGNYLSLINTSTLFKGEHEFKLLARARPGSEYQTIASRTFLVLGTIQENRYDRKKLEESTGIKKHIVSFHGNVQLSSADYFFRGPGSAYRQEPRYSRDVSTDLRLKVNKFEIPVQLRLTTNARGDYLFRNTFRAGVIRNRLRVMIGDHFADEDQLILAGIRIRGLQVTLPLGPASTLTFLGGINTNEFSSTINYPPGSSLTNELYVNPDSRYRRNYLFYKLHSGYNQDLDQYSISVLKSYDYVGDSLIDGIKPKDNFVFGFENLYSRWKRRSTLKLNVGFSVLTNDRSLPTEAEEYDKIIRLNSSTTPLSVSRMDGLAVLINYQLKWHPTQLLRIEGKRIGGSYNSLGNPFMMNNRHVLRGSNRCNVWKNRLFINMGYDLLRDNINKSSYYTREAHTGYTALMLSGINKWPGISIGYRYSVYNNFSAAILPNRKAINRMVYGTLNYSFSFKGFAQHVAVSRNETTLNSDLPGTEGQRIEDISFSTRFKNKYGLDLNGGRIWQNSNSAGRPLQTLSGRIWYNAIQSKLRLSARLAQTRSQDSFHEKRFLYSISGDFTPLKQLMVNLTAGKGDYATLTANRNYTEGFITLKVTSFF